jgi:septal ring factor EnvC (AmiA/AmiB activator)
MQVAQHSTVDRFAELQGLNRSLHQEITQLRQQLAHIAEEKEGAAAAERKRLTDRVKRRPERNRAFKVKTLENKRKVYTFQ